MVKDRRMKNQCSADFCFIGFDSVKTENLLLIFNLSKAAKSKFNAT